MPAVRIKMISKETLEVIEEIFNPGLIPEEVPFDENLRQPSFKEITEVAELVVRNAREEDFQLFFSRHPSFLFRSAPFSHDLLLGILIKPPIGINYKADYSIFTVGQGGPAITLIEIENPNDKLFTRRLTPSSELQTALGQIDDWNQWININKSTFVRDSFELLRKCPSIPARTHNGGFKTVKNKMIDDVLNQFEGESICIISNLLVIGRWSQLTKSEKNRLVFLNNKNTNQGVKIRTFDQIIKKGFEGQPKFW